MKKITLFGFVVYKKEATSNAHTENKTDSYPKNGGFQILLVMMMVGVLGILTISIFSCFAKKTMLSSFWPVLGFSLIIALAAAVCGGFLGFLFGIPRSLQSKNAAPSTTIVTPPAATTEAVSAAAVAGTTTTTTTERSYGNNTNLEEISDWLTKIIVGVSLTQLPEIEKRFDTLTRQASRGFADYFSTNLSYPYAGALMLFFTICGFFAVYLWSRIYFYEILIRLDKVIGDILKNEVKSEVKNQVKTQVDDKFAAQEKAALLKLWQERDSEFKKQKTRIQNAETTNATEEIKRVLATAQPAPVTILDDCQQNRWGGNAVAGGYEVKAAIIQKPDEPDYYDVTLTVEPVAGSADTINGDVYFFMHDSYYPNIIVRVPSVNNKVEYSFSSYEAFTVGVALNEGKTKLEINLNTLPGDYGKYKYIGTLYTYEEIKSELAKLEKSES